MEREIPLYSYDGQLIQWIDAKRLDRLVSMDRVSRVVKHPKGRIARAILRHMPGEPTPSFLFDYKGTQYCLRQRLGDAIVGGSRKHGGPDLGPTRTKKAWEQLGVNGLSLADEAPARDFVGLPRLTLPMVASLQGFPEDWRFDGGKTAVYRQIAQALPPAVAAAVGSAVLRSIT